MALRVWVVVTETGAAYSVRWSTSASTVGGIADRGSGRDGRDRDGLRARIGSGARVKTEPRRSAAAWMCRSRRRRCCTQARRVSDRLDRRRRIDRDRTRRRPCEVDVGVEPIEGIADGGAGVEVEIVTDWAPDMFRRRGELRGGDPFARDVYAAMITVGPTSDALSAALTATDRLDACVDRSAPVDARVGAVSGCNAASEVVRRESSPRIRSRRQRGRRPHSPGRRNISGRPVVTISTRRAAPPSAIPSMAPRHVDVGTVYAVSRSHATTNDQGDRLRGGA